MKYFNIGLFLIVIFVTIDLSGIAQIVTIPDANFKAYLVGNSSINTNLDGEIQVSEANAYTDSIVVTSMHISDLTGIEAFTALTYLDCSNNQIASIDLSFNTALSYLDMWYNYLSSLDVSANTALTHLNCGSNSIESLDVSANTTLSHLECSGNQLSSLDISANMALTDLGCSGNQLTSLDVTANTALTSLGCYSNQLTSLNVAANTALTGLSCWLNQLTSLDVSANTNLSYLVCGGNQLTSLDVSANTTLYHLNCNGNQLTSLDVSANTALTFLDCYDNQLISLNVKNGNNANFTFFDAANNPNLTCIEVDNAVYSTTNWTNIDITASYSEDCTTSIAANSINNDIVIYPNPTMDNIQIETLQNSDIVILNISGQIIKAIFNADKQTSINVADLSSGIYIIKSKTERGVAVKKFIKK